MTLYQYYSLYVSRCCIICECDRMSHLIIYNIPENHFHFAPIVPDIYIYIEGDYRKKKNSRLQHIGGFGVIHAKIAQEKAGCRCYVMLFILSIIYIRRRLAI